MTKQQWFIRTTVTLSVTISAMVRPHAPQNNGGLLRLVSKHP
jgi:hypothetical protein